MSELSDALETLHFPKLLQVEGRRSISDIFPKGKRCGIYVLQFSNREVYAGQAKDVTRRYVQHSKTHDDIAKISFKRVKKADLNDVERATIWELESKGFILRNIVFTSLPKGASDFDLLMPAENQNRWLDDLEYQDGSGSKIQDSVLRRKYKKKFQQFSELPQADAAISLLRRYVNQGIPIPKQSEIAFWGCSCLPGNSNSKILIYSRININWQEVLTLLTDKGMLVASFHLALSPLEKAYGDSLGALFKTFPSLTYTEHFYDPGGPDQIHLEIDGKESAMALLEDSNVIRAIRLFNIRLMKKGPCTFGRYHCMDLADQLLQNND